MAISAEDAELRFRSMYYMGTEYRKITPISIPTITVEDNFITYVTNMVAILCKIGDSFSYNNNNCVVNRDNIHLLTEEINYKLRNNQVRVKIMDLRINNTENYNTLVVFVIDA